MSYPQEGKAAPAFTLPASNGKKVSLKDFHGKTVVLYFYPKDNTSGCTKEACQFKDAIQEYERKDAVVVGISPDNLTSHGKFIDKFGLPFLLLSDEDHSIAEKYGVWQEKSMYGRKYFGIARTTFVIGKDGKVAKVFEKVKVPGHEKEVLKVIENLG
jgi:thioredoxin-dependent peroxiredoxin